MAGSDIDLRQIEREYSLNSGDVGRGIRIEPSQLPSIMRLAGETGYRLFETPGISRMHIPVLFDKDMKPTGILWFGFVREEAGKHYMAAFECAAS